MHEVKPDLFSLKQAGWVYCPARIRLFFIALSLIVALITTSCTLLKGPRKDTNHIPVMMITGVYKRAENNARALLRCRADDYLLKPFTMQQFLHRVKVLLNRTR